MRAAAERRDRFYDYALQVGQEKGIYHLRLIVSGFKIRDDVLTPEQRELLDAVNMVLSLMNPPELEPNNYSTSPPHIPQQISEPFDYRTRWWTVYSTWYRNEKKWVCEVCGLDLSSDRYNLHTHHTRGTQYNEPQELKALCIGCHAEQPGYGHSRLKTGSDYEEFMAKYGEQRKSALNYLRALSFQFEKDAERRNQTGMVYSSQNLL